MTFVSAEGERDAGGQVVAWYLLYPLALIAAAAGGFVTANVIRDFTGPAPALFDWMAAVVLGMALGFVASLVTSHFRVSAAGRFAVWVWALIFCLGAIGLLWRIAQMPVPGPDATMDAPASFAWSLWYVLGPWLVASSVSAAIGFGVAMWLRMRKRMAGPASPLAADRNRTSAST
jgi:hypothetical protein